VPSPRRLFIRAGGRWMVIFFFFFSSQRIIRREPIFENKKRPAIDPARMALYSILTSESNRIVEVEKLKQYFALPILFFAVER